MKKIWNWLKSLFKKKKKEDTSENSLMINDNDALMINDNDKFIL